MRKGLILLVAALTACASAAPPPGGPEDKAPPQLVRVTPDTNAVNVGDKYVTFQFDETINDRGTGAQELNNYFLVSPSDGAMKVVWHRSRIDVAPRRGFRPATAYTVTMLPGLADLRGNVMKSGAKVVFSTGAAIPPYRIRGIVFDWITERVAANAYLEAVTPDSIVYLAQADSMGRFEIGPLGQGTFLVRAVIDANNNRALDRNEAFDSVRVTVPTSVPTVELLAAVRDTLPVGIASVNYADSVTLRVVFDRSLDPAQTIAPDAFRLVGADSTPVPIARVLNPRQERTADSLARKAEADSVRRADSLAGKPLTPVRPAPAAAPQPGGRPAPPPPPVPSRPSPFSTLTIKLGRPLAPSSDYRLSARGLRSLTGRVRESERRFSTPKPPPVRPPADTAARPATPPRAP